MRIELKYKFIQHLSLHKRDNGFTLIELLVVIFIIGILSAIALPHLLNHSAKAKQSEAIRNLGLVNKIQNTYREEHQFFASTFDVLGLGTVTGGTTGSTRNYIYTISGTTNTATVTASAIDQSLKGYSGAAIFYSNSENLSVIGTVLCETIVPSAAVPPDISNVFAAPRCDPSVQTNVSF